MPRKSLDELKAYLSVLLDEETKARDRQPADLLVFDPGPPWPEVGPDLVGDQVGAEQSSPEKTKKLLVAQLTPSKQQY